MTVRGVVRLRGPVMGTTGTCVDANRTVPDHTVSTQVPLSSTSTSAEILRVRAALHWMTAVDETGEPWWPPIQDIAERTHKIRRALESILHDGTRDEYADDEITCLLCGSELKRRMLATGIEDNHWCGGCNRTLAPHEFYLAAAQAAELALVVELSD